MTRIENDNIELGFLLVVMMALIGCIVYVAITPAPKQEQHWRTTQRQRPPCVYREMRARGRSVMVPMNTPCRP